MPANTWPNPFDVETDYLNTKEGNADRHVTEMDDRYWRLHPDATPLTVIMGRANKDATSQPEFKWREENPGPMWDQLAADAAAASTALVVDHAIYFKPGDMIRVARTGEVIRVTAVTPATNTLTVMRDWPQNAAAIDAVTDDWVVRLGPAYKEGSSLPDPRIVVEETKRGFTQIYRRTYGVTGTEQATTQYGGPQLTKQRVSQGIDFRTELEYSAIFGKAGESFVGGEVIRQTGGLLDYIDTNAISVGGASSADAVTWNKLEAAFEQGFEFGAGNKILIVGRRLASIISEIAVNRVQTHVGEDTFGIHVSRLTSTHGTVDVVPHPLLKNDYARTGFLLDMNNFYMRPLAGNGVNRDIKMLSNRQVTGDDKVIEEYFAELGFCLKLEKTHALITAAGDFVS